MEKEDFQHKELLLIFTRNPQLGKVKSRLAASIGDNSALRIYRYLLGHTEEITRNLPVEKWVCYSEEIPEEDIWRGQNYRKKLQRGKGLGERMENAFSEAFKKGFRKVVIIGSDLFDIVEEDLKMAFLALDDNDYVMGPAQDGGYYLLGMRKETPRLFSNKEWSTANVFKQTLEDLKQEKLKLLPVRNDIDTFEDMKPHADLMKVIDKKEEL